MSQFIREAKVLVTNQDGLGVEFSNVRILFQVLKSSDSSSNTTEISIYNLNNDTSTFLEQNNLTIVLMCGYRSASDDLKVIFEGEITNAVTTMNGADKITTIYAGDADTGINLSEYQKTYRANTKIKTIIKEIATSMNVIVEDQNIADIPETSFINSYIAVGSTKKLLDELFKKIDLEWYVNDGIFYARKRIDIESTNAILISSQTGLIGSPLRKNEKSTGYNETEAGVSFTSVLNAELQVGATVNIESIYADAKTQGLFVIKEVKFEGDTHGTPWYTKCLCLGEKQNGSQ
jgi:hypothetical protein